MRTFQNILVMIGATALGIVSCIVLIFFVVAALSTSRAGEEPGTAFGGLVYFVFLGGCGSIFGAIAGFLLGLRWITQQESKPWPLTIWLGILLGLLIALSIRFFGLLEFCLLGDLIQWRSGIALFLAATATVGGFIGSIASSKYERQIAGFFERFSR